MYIFLTLCESQKKENISYDTSDFDRNDKIKLSNREKLGHFMT